MFGWKVLLLFLLAVLACGCATRHDVAQSFASGDSGIDGHLVATKSDGGSIEVAGGARGRVNVTTADETTQVATVDTDSGGNFEVGLRPGSYFVYTEPMEGMLYGRRVAVAPHQMTQLELRLPPQYP
jgi:hypothetical protein